MYRISFFAILSMIFCANANAQPLRITEILANSIKEPDYEWIEVENISGAPLNLSGAVLDDDDGIALAAANISSDLAANTIIPANGVAILYNGAELGFDNTRFRAAWALDDSVPLIGVAMSPALNNGGDAIAIWANLDDYTKDLMPDDDGDLRVDGFKNALFDIDFSVDTFPSPNEKSLYYSGIGDIKDGANWVSSKDGERNAYTSIATFFQSSQINSTDDVGSPGKIPDGPAADGLLITEIMYNPASEPDNSFEFVEIYNNTGGAIDFNETNFYFDDVGGGAFEEPNVTSGTVGNGEVAVLIDSEAVTVEQMKTAWGEDVNFIGVSPFSALNNGGDLIGLWNEKGDYELDKEAGSFSFALADVEYIDGNDGWPSDNGAASIYLSKLDGDVFDGANWALSDPEDGISANANAIFAEMVPDHPGGDIGSPGQLPGMVAAAGDFDGDGDLDADDINALTVAVGPAADEKFDVNNDGKVDGEDREVWVVSLKNTYFGDSNLDGEFGTADLVAVFQAGEYEDNDLANSTWEEGDWSGDFEFTTTDLVLAFQGGGFEIGPRVLQAAPVPEPSSLTLFGLSIVAIWFRWKRICG